MQDLIYFAELKGVSKKPKCTQRRLKKSELHCNTQNMDMIHGMRLKKDIKEAYKTALLA